MGERPQDDNESEASAPGGPFARGFLRGPGIPGTSPGGSSGNFEEGWVENAREMCEFWAVKGCTTIVGLLGGNNYFFEESDRPFLADGCNFVWAFLSVVHLFTEGIKFLSEIADYEYITRIILVN